MTQYGYNADTNVLEWVQYPEDTEATRTVYTYDNMYRLASAAKFSSDRTIRQYAEEIWHIEPTQY